MRFALIDTAKADFPIHRLCGVLGVSQSGYFARQGRPTRRISRPLVSVSGMSVCTNYNCETTKLPGRLPASWMGGERFIWGLSVKTK